MSNTPSKAEIEALVKRHGATSYRNRADTQHPAYGFTEDGLNGLIDEVLAKWGSPQPVVREPQWINPNDKTQQQYLPHIGEPVLFCHKGKTYYGKHTGGDFVSGVGFAQKHFNTWHCRWMYPPVAHGITKGGQHGTE